MHGSPRITRHQWRARRTAINRHTGTFTVRERRRLYMIAVVALSCVPACELPPPSESYFWRDVSDVVTRSESRRARSAAASATLSRIIVFSRNSIPSTHRGLEPVLKRHFTRSGIVWVDADSSADAPPIPGPGGKVAEEVPGAFNSEHCVLHLTVEGTGQEREVVWRYDCGTATAEPPQRVTFYWAGDIWTTTRSGPDVR